MSAAAHAIPVGGSNALFRYLPMAKRHQEEEKEHDEEEEEEKEKDEEEEDEDAYLKLCTLWVCCLATDISELASCLASYSHAQCS